MDASESYLEELQLVFDSYRRGAISKAELDIARHRLMERSEQGQGQGAAEWLISRGSLVLVAAICSMFLVSTIGFAGLSPQLAGPVNQGQVSAVQLSHGATQASSPKAE